MKERKKIKAAAFNLLHTTKWNPSSVQKGKNASAAIEKRAVIHRSKHSLQNWWMKSMCLNNTKQGKRETLKGEGSKSWHMRRHILTVWLSKRTFEVPSANEGWSAHGQNMEDIHEINFMPSFAYTLGHVYISLLRTNPVNKCLCAQISFIRTIHLFSQKKVSHKRGLFTLESFYRICGIFILPSQ